MEGEWERGKGRCSSKRLAWGKKRISLEDYMDFFLSNKSFDLTVNFLNQIIYMHGYRKMHNLQKRTLTDVVNALELIEPSRSTLKESDNGITSATVSLEEVMIDLKDLEWQECCVTSIQMLNAGTESSPSFLSSAAATALPSPCNRPKAKPRSNKRKKGVKVKMLNWVWGESSPGVQETGVQVKKKRRSRMMKKSRAVEAVGGGDGAATASPLSSALISLGSG